MTNGGAYIFVVVVVFVAVIVFACRRPHNAAESGGETITARRDGVEQCRRQRTREKKKKPNERKHIIYFRVLSVLR